MKRFFSKPTPCSPVSAPPASTHTRMIAAPASSTRAVVPGSRSSKSRHGCRLPSPAWNTFATGKPYPSLMRATSPIVSTSRERGTTPSSR